MSKSVAKKNVSKIARRELNALRRKFLADEMARHLPANGNAKLIWNDEAQACEVVAERPNSLKVRPRFIIGRKVMTGRAYLIPKYAAYTSLLAAKNALLQRLKWDARWTHNEIKRVKALKHTPVAA